MKVLLIYLNFLNNIERDGFAWPYLFKFINTMTICLYKILKYSNFTYQYLYYVQAYCTTRVTNSNVQQTKVSQKLVITNSPVVWPVCFWCIPLLGSVVTPKYHQWTTARLSVVRIFLVFETFLVVENGFFFHVFFFSFVFLRK